MALIQRTPGGLPVHVKVLTVEFHADPPLPEALMEHFLEDAIDAVNRHGYVSEVTDPDPAPLVEVDARDHTIVGNGLRASEYVIRHPEEYGVRATLSIGTGLGYWRSVPELVLLDRQGDPIDEAGCNCDDSGPCNNPKCVMEREKEAWP